MKEATGELNMTVITVVAIVAVGALFTWFVWPTIKANLAINTACSTIDSHGNSTTTSSDDKDSKVECSSFTCVVTYFDGDGAEGKTYTGNCSRQ